jgi:hypothetical protein
MDQQTEPAEFSTEQLVLFQATAKELKVPLPQLLQLAETQHRNEATDRQPQDARPANSSQVAPLPEDTPAITTSQLDSNILPNRASFGVPITTSDNLPTLLYHTSWLDSHSHFFPMNSGAMSLPSSLTRDSLAPTSSIGKLFLRMNQTLLKPPVDPQFIASQTGFAHSIPNTSPINMAHITQLDTLRLHNSMVSTTTLVAFNILSALDTSGYIHICPEDDPYSTLPHSESSPSLYHYHPNLVPRIVDLDYESSLSGPPLNEELSIQDKIDMRKSQKKRAAAMRKTALKNTRQNSDWRI